MLIWLFFVYFRKFDFLWLILLKLQNTITIIKQQKELYTLQLVQKNMERVTIYNGWEILKTWKSKTRFTRHELRFQIYELRVQIYQLRVQIHELRVQIHELEH